MDLLLAINFDMLPELSSALLAFGVGVLLGYLISQTRQKVAMLRLKEKHASQLEDREYELGALEARAEDYAEQLEGLRRKAHEKEDELLALIAERDQTVDGLVDELSAKARLLHDLKSELEQARRGGPAAALRQDRDKAVAALRREASEKEKALASLVRTRADLSRAEAELEELRAGGGAVASADFDRVLAEAEEVRQQLRERGLFEEGLRRELDRAVATQERLSAARAELEEQLSESEALCGELHELYLSEVAYLHAALAHRERDGLLQRSRQSGLEEQLDAREAEFDEYRSELASLCDTLREREAELERLRERQLDLTEG